MTQEEKSLLLKDLCARLPYGVKVSVPNGSLLKLYSIIDCKTAYLKVNDDAIRGWKVNIEEIKPYLHPMSSMTEEERSELSKLTNDKFKFYLYTYTPEIICYGNYNYFDGLNIFDWLNSHHFDYRGLIEKGLALEAPEDMYKED